MERNLIELTSKQFDVLVIGAGIHGACVAWDAISRGLSVALIDKGDFGSATSQNSLKIIHGGLRYIQDGNISIIRTMVQERRTWLKIAPHLVHPLPCLLPTNNSLARNRVAMSLALQLNNLLSYDRNRSVDPQKSIPNGKWISSKECKQLFPGLNSTGMTGAGLWYDAQIYNTERLLMSVVLSAYHSGAVLANYVEAVGFLHKGTTINGVMVRDVFTGQDFEIQASMVINCTGAWVDTIFRGNLNEDRPSNFYPSVALNLVTRRIWDNFGIGLSSRPGVQKNNGRLTSHSQVLFFVPWKQYSIIGTWHIPLHISPEKFEPTEEIIQHFLDAVNSTNQNVQLSLDDVLHVHFGFLPMIPRLDGTHKVRLVREGKVIDHRREDGISGLITVLGVKYTTSRLMAEKAVDMALNQLEYNQTSCRTNELQLIGGEISSFNDFLNRETNTQVDGLDPDLVEHLLYSYGSEYKQILEYIEHYMTLGKQVTAESPVIKAEIVHAVRKEMAQTLADVILRRTELGAAGPPSPDCLSASAQIMGAELGWDQEKIKQSITEVLTNYPKILIRTQPQARSS